MVLKTVAVTGATGMLGSHLVARLRQGGFEVVPVTRAEPEVTGSRRWALLEWRSRAECDQVFRGVDAVVHSAAVITPEQPEEGLRTLFDANVRSCAMLGDWALYAATPLVFISSSSVYENPEARSIRETDSVDWSGLGGPYALSKILAEDVFARLRYAGLKVAVLRPSSLYGYGEPPTRIVSKFLSIAADGGRIDLSEPYGDAVDFVHAADVANAVGGVLRSECWETYNVASEAMTTIKELAELCVSVAGSGSVELKRTSIPASSPRTRFQLNCDLARRDYRFSPQIGLATGVRAVFERQVISVDGDAHG